MERLGLLALPQDNVDPAADIRTACTSSISVVRLVQLFHDAIRNIRGGGTPVDNIRSTKWARCPVSLYLFLTFSAFHIDESPLSLVLNIRIMAGAIKS